MGELKLQLFCLTAVLFESAAHSPHRDSRYDRRYEPDTPIVVAVVMVQLILELGLEIVVDVTAMWAESEHGIPMTQFFQHAKSPFVVIFHFGAALVAMCWAGKFRLMFTNKKKWSY